MPSVKEDRSFLPRVEQLLGAGVPIGDAIRLALHDRDRAAWGEDSGQPEPDPRGAITRFIARHGFKSRGNVSSMLHGGRAMSLDVAAALAEDLGTSVEDVRQLYKRAAEKSAA